MPQPLDQMTNEQLWRLFPIILEAHNPARAQRYEDEKSVLTSLLPSKAIVRITHIGSTSVPGLIAKPTIDILLEIRPESDFEQIKETLVSDGWIYSPQPNKPAPGAMFMKGYTPEGFRGQAFHLHVRYPGDWDELYFCRWLRLSPETARAYEQLKISLKEKYEHDRDAYTDEKTGFVLEQSRRAREQLGVMNCF